MSNRRNPSMEEKLFPPGDSDDEATPATAAAAAPSNTDDIELRLNEPFEDMVDRWWQAFKGSSSFPFLSWQDPAKTGPVAAMIVLWLGLATFTSWGAVEIAAIFGLSILLVVSGAGIASRSLSVDFPVPALPQFEDAKLEAWGKRQGRRVSVLLRYFDRALRVESVEVTADLAAKLWVLYYFGWIVRPSTLFALTIVVLTLPAAVFHSEETIKAAYREHASPLVKAAGAEISKLAQKLRQLRSQNEQTFNIVAGAVALLLLYILLNVVGFSWATVATAGALAMALRRVLPAGAIITALVDFGHNLASTQQYTGGSDRKID